jgi:hypothetical protein
VVLLVAEDTTSGVLRKVQVDNTGAIKVAV